MRLAVHIASKRSITVNHFILYSRRRDSIDRSAAGNGSQSATANLQKLKKIEKA